MRIGFISYEFPPDTGKGGIGTYITQVATLLANLNWDIHVFAGSFERNITEKINGFTVHRVLCTNPFDFRQLVVNAFEKEHMEQPFQLMESPEIHGNAWEIKKKFASLPLVVRFHAPDSLVESLKKKYAPFFSKLRFFFGALRRFKWDAGYWRKYDKKRDPDYDFTSLADHLVAPSVMMKKWINEYWGINNSKIEIVPNPFNPSSALLDIPIEKAYAHKTIIFFGRLNVLKGLVNATQTVKKILSKYPEWRFKIIGDDGPGPVPGGHGMKAWMQQQLQPFQSRVSFFPGVDYSELPALIREGEIVLLPSLFESFSYTCAEAMAAGKCVVASLNTGMSDMIQNLTNGILVDPENITEIFDAVELLIKDEALGYHMATNAREMIKTKYTPAKLDPLYTEFYKKVVSQQIN